MIFTKNSLPNKINFFRGSTEAKNEFKASFLFLLTVCSPIMALLLILMLLKFNGHFIKNMWVFYFFLVPASLSVLFGKASKRQGFKYKKNVISGIVSFAMLSCLGSFAFIFEDKYIYCNNRVLMAEEIIGIDIPKYSTFVTQKLNAKIAIGTVFYVSDIQFDSSNVNELENYVKSEKKWLDNISIDMLPVTSPVFHLDNTNYTLIHNKTTGETNRLPEKDGTYDFICIMYDLYSNRMEIVEYQMNLIL